MVIVVVGNLVRVLSLALVDTAGRDEVAKTKALVIIAVK